MGMVKTALQSGYLGRLVCLFFTLLLVCSAETSWVRTAQAQGKIQRQDVDGDGKVDQVAHLGPKGNLIRLDVDSNGDGRMDTFQFYEQGAVVRIERDTNWDGCVDEKTFLKAGRPRRQEKYDAKGQLTAILIFDTHGNPLKWQRDTTGDGRLDTIYEYKQGKPCLIKRDTIGDSRPDVWEYISDGIPYKQEADLNGDGKVDQVSEYDSQGHMVKSCHDLDGDGYMETLRIYRKNQIVRQEKDTNKNGRPEIVTIFENGEVVSEKRDTNGGGKFDVVISMVNGKAVSMQEDTDHSGKMDKFTEFDTRGRAALIQQIDENTDRPIRITRFKDGKVLSVKQFDHTKVIFTKFNKGKPIMQTIDQNGDGQWDQTIVFDKKGKMSKALLDTNHDGKIDCTQYYHEGILTMVEQDRNYDGMIDAKIQYKDGKQVQSLFDNDGDQIFETRIRFDDPRWSKVVEVLTKQGKVWEQEFFLNGVLRQKKRFDPGTGAVIYVEEYNERGKIVVSREAEKASGKLNLVWYYDDQGNAVRAERDSNGDGRVDIWFYYQDGRIVRIAEDRNKDGRPDLWEEYDSSQKVAMRKEDVDFDGIADIEKRF